MADTPQRNPLSSSVATSSANDASEREDTSPYHRDRSDSAYSGYSRAYTRVLTTTLFDMLDYVSPDDHEWTQDMLKSYGKIEEKGNEGDVPEQPAFAKDIVFWVMMACASFLGVAMGFAGLIFLNIIDEVPPVYLDTDEFDDPDTGELYAGKVSWIFILTAAGFLVGFLRWITKYPDNLPGFFKEVNDCHVDPTWALHTVIFSAISIAGGANSGPEQAMGNLGGGLATILEHKLELEDEDDKKLLVLTGMSAAMGSLFPTPVLASLMIHELASPPKGFMESTLLMSVAAILSFVIFYVLEEKTWLDHLESNYALSYLWEFDVWQIGTAVVIGFTSSAICLGLLLTIGIVKQIMFRIKMRCDATKFLSGTIVICTLGGFINGILAYVVPLSFGNGHQTNVSVISNVEHYSTHTLLVTAATRVFTLAVSMNCGFVGGFVLPVISIGIICGVICHQQYDYLPLGLCVACFMSSLPAAICPMPFTLFSIATSIFFFGLYQTVPVFVACITSYLMLTGIGLLGALQARAKQNQQASAPQQGKQENGSLAEKEEPLNPYRRKEGKTHANEL